MKDLRFAKFVVLVNAAVPLTLLGYDAYRHQLGANPTNFAIRTTGMLTLVFLALSLAVTPARLVTGWNALVAFRRLLGLYAFFYSCLHFLLFFGLDRAWSVSDTLSEIAKRLYLLVGIVGVLVMVPLAVTSTNAMIRRLGPRRWKALHRLAYVAGIAGVLHYWMLVKADLRQPAAFAITLAFLLGFRFVWHYVQLRAFYKTRSAQPAAPAAFLIKPRFWTGQMRVARVFQETPDVRTFRLVPADADGSAADVPFSYLPAQYMNLMLDVGGKRVNRSYTIASTPTRASYCELTIKRESMGVASGHLHDQLREGGVLNVSAPAGRFTFTGAEADSIALIAAGVGVTPLMAIVRYLTDRSWPGDIYFVYSAKTERDIIFRLELENLRQRFPNLHVCITLTQADGTGWAGERGRISAELLNRAVPAIASRLVYVCGPTPMMEPTKQLLRDLGVSEDRIKTEAFAYPDKGGTPQIVDDMGAGKVATSAAAANGETFTVTFAKAGKTADVTASKTILEASEAAGVNIEFDCRAGICGSCKTKLLAGRVVMDVQDALDPSDRMNNVILACQARPTEAVTVNA